MNTSKDYVVQWYCTTTTCTDRNDRTAVAGRETDAADGFINEITEIWHQNLDSRNY